MKRQQVTFDLIRELALKLPGVEEGTSYGTAALRVKKKFMARLKEDGESVVFRVGFDERELLMQTKPEVFYITDHYLHYPAILIRLSKVHPRKMRQILEHAWRAVAPKRLVQARDGEGER